MDSQFKVQVLANMVKGLDQKKNEFKQDFISVKTENIALARQVVVYD